MDRMQIHSNISNQVSLAGIIGWFNQSRQLSQKIDHFFSRDVSQTGGKKLLNYVQRVKVYLRY